MDDDGEVLDRLQRIMEDLVAQAREERRPRLEDVVRVLDESFAKLTAAGDLDVVKTASGPDVWIWSDRQMHAEGFEKVYVLTRSLLPGAEGFPLLTIRQAVGPVFDAHLSLSNLVFGPSDVEIARSVGMLITNHAGAFQGLKESITAISRGGTRAGLDLLKEKREAEDPVTDVIPPKGELN